MNYLKTSWSKIILFLQCLGMLGKSRTMIDTFPGMDDQAAVRVWIIQQTDNFLPVVEKTGNKIDDRAMISIRRVALNEKAFNAIFNLMVLAWEGLPMMGYDPVFGETERRKFTDFCDMLDDETVENPLLFISVAGLLLQVITFIKARKA